MRGRWSGARGRWIAVRGRRSAVLRCGGDVRKCVTGSDLRVSKGGWRVSAPREGRSAAHERGSGVR